MMQRGFTPMSGMIGKLRSTPQVCRAIGLIVLAVTSTGFAGDPQPPTILGATSCAAAGCHGGSRAAEGIGFAAYRIWQQHDPHAQAYAVLHSARSVNIATRLNLPQPAHRSRECLACHATQPSPNQQVSPQFTLADGVSCESCHGASDRWLTDHSRPAWRSLSFGEKSSLGLHDTKDFRSRARLCTHCHIGTADRDVNHDLIAAGHPRLDFEFAALQVRYPRHWSLAIDELAAGGRPNVDGSVTSGLEATLWLIGQLAAAETTLELTRARAADRAKPWPELTEYGCFSCHHELRSDSWRIGGPNARLAQPVDAWDHDPPGALVWQPGVFALASRLPSAEGRWQPALRKLRVEIRRADSDRDQVVRLADEALKMLRTIRDATPMPIVSAEDCQMLLQQVAADSAVAARHWESAAQSYLAATVLGLSAAELSGGVRPFTGDFGWRNMLRFPPDRDSPSFDAATQSQLVPEPRTK